MIALFLLFLFLLKFSIHTHNTSSSLYPSKLTCISQQTKSEINKQCFFAPPLVLLNNSHLYLRRYILFTNWNWGCWLVLLALMPPKDHWHCHCCTKKNQIDNKSCITCGRPDTYGNKGTTINISTD